MEQLLRRMLPVGAPIAEAEDVDYSFAVEYSGPLVHYDIPRAIPIDIDRIPLAAVAAEPDPSLPGWLSLPVVHPLLPSTDPRREMTPHKGGGDDAEESPAPAFDGETTSGEIGSSPGVSEAAAGFSSEFKESVDFSSNDTNPPMGRSSTESALSSEEYGFHFSASCDEADEAPAGNGKRESLVTFQDAEVGEATPSEEESGVARQGRRREGSASGVRKGACHRCRRGNRFTEKEVCLVCNAKYCSSCVLTAMGSMPEGRKCVSCIGLPIDESMRERVSKCSRMLMRLLSSLEVQQVMNSEKFCEANQLRPEEVYVNGRQLCGEEMAVLQSCPNPPGKLKPGYYWYDKVSGLWGKEGHRPQKIISSHLNVGGILMRNASNGNTGVFINNREITNVELQMLQWTGVQCAGNPHFWVNADGSYQEEGQKNIKGHLWTTARMKLVCYALSLPVPPKTALSSREEVKNVVSRVLPGYLEQRTLQKLLLIGYHGSGTSTIFKQAKFLYKQPVPFSEEERESIKLIIQSSIYSCLGILLEGREQFEEESLAELRRNQSLEQSVALGDRSDGCDGQTSYSIGPRLRSFSDWLLKVMASGNLEAIFVAATREYAPYVEELWNDAAIQATYSRRSELQPFPSSAIHFLERVVDISRAEYVPSDMDILYADGITSSNGLASTDIFPQLPSSGSGVDGDDQHETLLRYQLIRVHARGLGENCKWLEMFEDVQIIIFCVALSDYDEYCEDATGMTVNKMLASKKLFESIATNPTFDQMNFLLVLNKFDLLKQKIDRAPLKLCDWFCDFSPVSSSRDPNNSNGRNPNTGASLPQQAFHYIAVKFKRLFASLTGRKLYVTTANSLDLDSVDSVLRYAREILKWEEERAGFGSSEFSAYSTEPSSFSN